MPFKRSDPKDHLNVSKLNETKNDNFCTIVTSTIFRASRANLQCTKLMKILLPARRYASAGLCDSDVSVCLSVRPPYAGIVPSRAKAGS